MTLEGIAEMLARLDDPFASRAAVLAQAGLEEAAWTSTLDAWLSDLRTMPPDESRDVADRFARAYQQTKIALVEARALVLGRAAEQSVSDARFLTSDIQPWRSEAAAVALSAPGELDATADGPPVDVPWSALQDVRPLVAPSVETEETITAVPVLSPALPFHHGDPIASIERALAASPPRGGPSTSGETQELRTLPEAELPFSRPGKRLARFDPQTGQPLATPQWVDIADPTPRRK